MENKIICGDTSKVLFELIENSIDLTVTSPPYGKLRDYSGDIWNFNICKKIIEGLYYVTKPGDEQNRIKYFKNYGYNCLIIWEHEFKDINNILQKVLNFERRK